ncbi:MAG: hypothetical protein WDW38_003559 [Sanguina aurantia]
MATPAWARCSVAILCIALFLAHLSTAAAQAPHYTLHSPPLRTLHHRPSLHHPRCCPQPTLTIGDKHRSTSASTSCQTVIIVAILPYSTTSAKTINTISSSHRT